MKNKLIKNKVSIITATYNDEAWIVDTYNSILAQSHEDWEWLITDDSSSDKTFDIITQLASNDQRIKLFKNDINSGAAVSRNRSISHSDGEFIAFLDSDDLWHPLKLEKQLDFMGDNIDFSFTAYELVDSEGESLDAKVDSSQSGSFSYDDMLKKKATMGCSTVMLRISAFDDLSMPLLRTGQDYALWLKLLKSGALAHVLNDVLTQYRILPNSISRNKFKKAKRQWEIYRKLEGIGLFYSSINFVFYAYRAVFRRR
ncbi:glycosyl transferase family 2 [Vibrio lentus]|nr:glycosyl transferase family 2 [Vibrio lentus]